MSQLPTQGLSSESIKERLAQYRKNDLNWRSGRVWAYVYPTTEEISAIQKWAFTEFLTENALDPTAFPSLMRMENEVIGFAAAHLSGDENVVGNLTTGGTESCLLAVKTARDWARREKGIREPEIILPRTAHAAFFKAAHYFDVKPVVVEVEPGTFRVSPEKVAQAITKDTALIVASAPQYPHGVVDPIEAIAAIAKERGLLCHVDGCIGGFLLPYFRRLGRKVPAFDFAVPGVTSISMDLHKYAYCPKGASVILYRSKEIRKHQIFTCSSWAGYTIVNPTMLSTRSGGPIAAAWATMHAFGDAGYLEVARQTLEATDQALAAIRSIPELYVLSDPEMSLIAFTSDTLSPFVIADEMSARGFLVQPQLASGVSPANLHLSMTSSSLPNVAGFATALRESCEAAKKVAPSAMPDMSQLAGMLGGGSDALPMLLGAMGIQIGKDGTKLPERMADVNGVLNALPAEAKDMVLNAFVNEMFQQG
jgi:glutamate/tyrosine decarboxylase-like PLP-dependent enzyme